MINKLKFVFTVAVVLNLQWVVSVNAGELHSILLPSLMADLFFFVDI